MSITTLGFIIFWCLAAVVWVCYKRIKNRKRRNIPEVEDWKYKRPETGSFETTTYREREERRHDDSAINYRSTTSTKPVRKFCRSRYGGCDL